MAVLSVFAFVVICSVSAVLLRAKDSESPPYGGLLDSSTAQRLPQAYVIYPEGFRSINMPVGNASQYATIFGGTVVRL